MIAEVDYDLVLWWADEEEYEYYAEVFDKYIYRQYGMPYFGEEE